MKRVISFFDSVVTVDLTINHADATVTVEGNTITANATNATYRWLDCDNGNAKIPDETGQSFTAIANDRLE